MKEPKPCWRCGRPKPAGSGVKVCGTCPPVEQVWDRLRQVDECWIWRGPTCKGYGRHRQQYVHRLVYEALVCEIPPGLDLDHLCRITLCANPWHLEPVTRAENNRRKWAMQTHCKQGHEFSVANTYIDPQGGRNCRTCTNAQQKRYQARRKAAA